MIWALWPEIHARKKYIGLGPATQMRWPSPAGRASRAVMLVVVEVAAAARVCLCLYFINRCASLSPGTGLVRI